MKNGTVAIRIKHTRYSMIFKLMILYFAFMFLGATALFCFNIFALGL